MDCQEKAGGTSRSLAMKESIFLAGPFQLEGVKEVQVTIFKASLTDSEVESRYCVLSCALLLVFSGLKCLILVTQSPKYT